MRMRPGSTVLGLFFGVACATTTPPPAAAPPASAPTVEAAPPPAAPAAPSPAVARVDGHAISAADLAAHAKTSGLPPVGALQDLIDLELLRKVAAEQGVAMTADGRAAAEVAVAKKLGLEVPEARDLLVVDHAWVKDASRAKTAAGVKALGDLRAKVVAGQALPEAFKTLAGVDSSLWHIGDHEEYPYTVVPAEAHDLPPGSVSPVIAGDGGHHLFKIYERKSVPPPADVVHAIVRDRLREGRTIELLDAAP